MVGLGVRSLGESMNYILLVGLVCACRLTGQPSPGTGSIEGRVLNSLTSAPVRKTSVNLSAARVWLLAETDAEGRFQFTALPAGNYKLSATRSGFIDQQMRRLIVVGQDAHVTDVGIRLRPLSTLSGRVLDEDGDPADGASINIFKQIYRNGIRQWDQLNSTAVTNDSGEYRFPGLAPGRYLVEARHLRPMTNNHYGDRDSLGKPMMTYVPAYYPNSASEQTASAIEIGLGSDVRDIDIHLYKSPLFHVRGKVVGASPNSQTQIGVSLRPAYGAATSGGGESAYASPPDYTFDASVIPAQYKISAIQGYADTPEGFATDTVTVAGNVSGVVLTMGPATEVTALVSLAEAGSRVNLQGVKVYLHNLGAGMNGLGGGFGIPSEATGRLSFAKPTFPGHYSVWAEGSSLPAGIYLKAVKLGGQEIPVGDFESVSSAEIEFVFSTKAGAISGSVVSEDGKPIPDARATLLPADGNSGFAAQSTDDTGKFKFTSLRPGKYKLLAWEEVEDGLWQDPEFCKKFGTHAKDVTIGPNETQDVQLSIVALEEMK